jgi:hypothetical protein
MNVIDLLIKIFQLIDFPVEGIFDQIILNSLNLVTYQLTIVLYSE